MTFPGRGMKFLQVSRIVSYKQRRAVTVGQGASKSPWLAEATQCGIAVVGCWGSQSARGTQRNYTSAIAGWHLGAWQCFWTGARAVRHWDGGPAQGRKAVRPKRFWVWLLRFFITGCDYLNTLLALCAID